MVSLHQFKDLLKQAITKKPAWDYLIILMAVTYSIIFSYAALYMYNNFMNYIDLGAYTQALYTTSFSGKLLYENFDALNTMLREGSAYYGSYLGIHFSPLMFLFVPFFTMFPSAEALLVLKTIAIGFSVIPAYYLAKGSLKTKTAFSVALLYIINPALQTLTLTDFQAQAFFPLLFLSAVYFVRKKNYILYYPALILSLMTMEFMSILVASFVVIELFFKRHSEKNVRLHLLASLLIAVGWWIGANLIMSAFKPPALSPWASTLEGGLFQAISYRFFEKVAFLLLMFIPFAFLPLKSLYVLSLVPWIGIILTSSTSSGSAVYQLGWHYGAYFLPLLYLAFVHAVANGRKKTDAHMPAFESVGKLNGGKLSRTLLIACIIVSVSLSPLNPLATGNLPGIAYSPRPFSNEHVQLVNDIIAMIPPNASVLAQTPLSQHLATRLHTYIYVADLDEYGIEYIIADTKHWDFTYVDFDNIVKSAINTGKFGIYAYGDGVLLLKKGYHEQPIFYRSLIGIFDYSGLIASKLSGLTGTLVLGDSFAIVDPSSKSRQVIMYDPSSGWGDIIWSGPGVWLLPSTYKVTFALKVDSNRVIKPEDYLFTIDIATVGGRVLVKKPLYGLDVPTPGKWFNVTLDFAFDRIADGVEFRGLNAKTAANVYLDYILLEQTSISYAPRTYLIFNYEDLGVNEGEVINGVIVHKQNNGTMWFSPVVTLPSGNYTAKFWLRLDDAYEGHVIDIEATNTDLQKLAYTDIYSGNFTSVGSWQPFEFSFTLNTYGNAKFTGLNVENDAKVSLLYIEVQSGY